MNDIVHLIEYASQPDIQFVCDKEWSTPSWPSDAWRKGIVLPEGIYLADNKRRYTFEKSKTTCECCLKLATKSL